MSKVTTLKISMNIPTKSPTVVELENSECRTDFLIVHKMSPIV